MRLTNGRGVDLTLGAVGRNETVTAAIDCTRKGGTVTLIGNIASEVTLPLQKVVTRQLRVQGSGASAGNILRQLSLSQVERFRWNHSLRPLRHWRKGRNGSDGCIPVNQIS
jgi:L-iditol 2-dehydrogenase